VDWDEDGTDDFLVGSRNGMVMYFQGSPSDAAPILSYVGYICASGSPIFVGANSAPFVVDWNEDGLHDLLMGAENKEMGSVPPSTRIYLNSGSTGNPLFTTYSELYCSGDPIEPHRCIPWVIDLSGDGKKDLICGVMEGCYLYFENTGTNQVPSFTTEDSLRYTGGSVIQECSDTRPVITDWNEDGVLDMVSGYADGTVKVYLGQQTGIGEGSVPVPLTDPVAIPNPARGSIVIMFDKQEQSGISVSVYDCSGRIVHSIPPVTAGAGSGQLTIGMHGHPSGMYTVRVSLGGYTGFYRVVLLR
jgi:hypothetical protein